MSKTFDPICHDLAKKFLAECPDDEDETNGFAAYIQDCAEWWMEEHSNKAVKKRADREAKRSWG